MNRFQKFAIVIIIITAAFLRFYKLGLNPPGLYWDEAAFGYNAYSILKTAHDEHGRFLPYLAFESFGDWKLPVYFYLIVPSIAIFGLNEVAVRFPSAFLGTLTIPVFFILVKKLSKNVNLAILSALFLAISPWHIQFSRAGFETSAGLFFVVSGVYLFLIGLESKSLNLRGARAHLGGVFRSPFTFSFLLLTLSMYTYHAYRVFVPLAAVSLVVIYKSEIQKNLSKIFLSAALGLILFLPLLIFTFSAQGKYRATFQTAFHVEDFKMKKLDYDQKSKRPLRFLSKYIYQKPIYYAYVALNGYIDHFSPFFLFLRGDQIGRHSQVDLGQINFFEVIFIGASLFAVQNLNKNTKRVMLSWLLLSPIPAMIVTPTPHADRTLQMAPALAFFSALGAFYIFSKVKLLALKFAIIIFCLFYFVSYFHFLKVHYPVKFAADWQDGYKQMVQKIEAFQDDYDRVYVTNINQVPYIYLLFYQKYDPEKFLRDGGTKEAFGKYTFVSRDFDVYDKGRILYVAPSWQKVNGKWLAAANDSSGRHIYSLWEVGGKD